ncbi:MAG: Fur family transcriptional regulator [Ectothiorhodospiraceae bacterium]|jgi:Fur family zinc uptake transcriptional regulator
MSHRDVVSPFQDLRHDHRGCISEALAEAERLCRERGARLTPLRRRVLELVWSSHAPTKAYDLLEQLRGEKARVAPPTVYRALDFLLAEGLIHRLESLNAFVGCGDPARTHFGQFLICERCEAVAELSDPEVSDMLTSKAGRLGFAMSEQTIELAGVCPACRRAEP